MRERNHSEASTKLKRNLRRGQSGSNRSLIKAAKGIDVGKACWALS